MFKRKQQEEEKNQQQNNENETQLLKNSRQKMQSQTAHPRLIW